MLALFGITRSSDDPRWVLIVFVAGLAASWVNHWQGRWWWARSRTLTVIFNVVWIGLFVALLAVD